MPTHDPVEKYREQPPSPRTRKPGHGDYARKEKDYEPQTVRLSNDGVNMGYLREPPRVSDQLVPGSRFSNEDWERAATMIASGCAMIQVAKAMGASRATIWRAYTASKDVRVRTGGSASTSSARRRRASARCAPWLPPSSSTRCSAAT